MNARRGITADFEFRELISFHSSPEVHRVTSCSCRPMSPARADAISPYRLIRSYTGDRFSHPAHDQCSGPMRQPQEVPQPCLG